ncbi:hypothetical protein QVD17_06342 [Tagetes erecta]|uniref:Late embryogenesis abundant protein LEA-2 subgroup domain-containing protein n=1 Tax=Tagetes erecta TaxID=13708 RepID=A0AAD8LGQ7_TARER|nr:hypothetical protein QVD17_06342 [Tagetes erecta]
MTAKSPQHCGKNKHLIINKKLIALFISILLLLTLILLFCFVLRPTKPHFSLDQLHIYQLFVSPTYLVNSSIQLTLLSTNPNQRFGIYYDQIQFYASYKAQQITLHSYVSPFYQDHKDTNLLSALLAANAFPVAPSFSFDLGRDLMAGRLVLNIKANGLLRWKLGTWVSGSYRFSVNCVAVLLVFGSSVPFTSKQGTQCFTTI